MAGFERLTDRDDHGDAYIKGQTKASLTFNGIILAGTALNRLAEYEESGLTPDEAARAFKADCEDRMVILPYTLGHTVHLIVGGEIVMATFQKAEIGFYTWLVFEYVQKAPELKIRRYRGRIDLIVNKIVFAKHQEAVAVLNAMKERLQEIAPYDFDEDDIVRCRDCRASGMCEFEDLQDLRSGKGNGYCSLGRERDG